MTMTIANPSNATVAVGRVVYAKLRDAEVHLNKAFFGRQTANRVCLVGLVGAINILLVGVPGTAKSQLATALFNIVDDSRTKSILFTKFTAPEEFFGPFDVQKMMGSQPDSAQVTVVVSSALLANMAVGVMLDEATIEMLMRHVVASIEALPVNPSEYVRDLEGYAADAHFIMADELGKASSAILNSMLTLVNEHIFHNGKAIVQAPLKLLVGASNEIPDSEELAAIFDRLPLRVEVTSLGDADFEAYLGDRVAGTAGEYNGPHITLTELEFAHAEVKQVAISQQVISDLGKLRATLRDDGFIASDRRWGQMLRILQAHAWLEGRDFVDDNDYEILQHGLWSRPAERTKIASKIAGVASPLKAEVNEIVDNIAEIMDNLTTAARKAKDGIKDKDVKTLAMEKHDDVKEAQAKLGALMKLHDKPFIQLALDRVKSANKTIVSKFFGLTDD